MRRFSPRLLVLLCAFPVLLAHSAHAGDSPIPFPLLGRWSVLGHTNPDGSFHKSLSTKDVPSEIEFRTEGVIYQSGMRVEGRYVFQPPDIYVFTEYWGDSRHVVRVRFHVSGDSATLEEGPLDATTDPDGKSNAVLKLQRIK